MSRRSRARADAGFLLAETLITFALSALVLVGLVSSAAVLLRATDRSVGTIGSADDLGRTLGALGRDIAGLKRARWNGEEPQRFVFRGGPNSLSFAQEVPAADGGRDLRVIALREIVQGRGTALTRSEAHLSAAATGWDALQFGTPRTVPTGPARLRFRYLAEQEKDAPAPRPVDAWPSGKTLPAAIIVEAVEADTKRLLVSDRIAVQADADIGCSDRTPPNREAGNSLPGAPGSVPGAPLGPQQALAAPPNLGGPFDVTTDVANKNEFCGRADKGIATDKARPAPTGAALPVQGAQR